MYDTTEVASVGRDQQHTQPAIAVAATSLRRIVPLGIPRARENATSSAQIIVAARAGAAGRNPETREQDRIEVTRVSVSTTSEHCFYAGLDGVEPADGVFVASFIRHDIGTLVIADVELPELGESFRVRGLVDFECTEDFSAGVTPGFGVRFIGLSDRARKAIAQFAESRENLFYESDITSGW